MKNIITTTTLFSLMAILILSCSNESSEVKIDSNSPKEINGEAQGTTYKILYFGKADVPKKSVDSLLNVLDQSMSLWVESSMISRFNNTNEAIEIDKHFLRNLMTSYIFYENTHHAFNPLVKPLVTYWGFGKNAKQRTEVDSSEVSRLLELTKMENLRVIFGEEELAISDLMLQSRVSDTLLIKKTMEGMQLDFNAIAQGYSADMLSRLMLEFQIENYLIEIGGEMVARGEKKDGSKWKVGIDKPEENASQRKLEATLELDYKAIATSGNYRKFYEIDGKKYHHTIDPVSGYPAKKEILSATVISSTCASADALATSFMVMGLEKSIKYMEANKNSLDAFLIYSKEDGSYGYYTSERIKNEIELVE